MKYHEKLNLKSPIFKYNNTATSRTPIKSPVKPAVNPTDLFHKVCCPNCKYGFKIIRPDTMKGNPVQSATPKGKKTKTHENRQMETQTQQFFGQSQRNSPNKSNLTQSKLSKTYDWSMMQQNGNRKDEISRVYIALQDENSQRKLLKDSQFKFKPLSLSPHSKFSKSKNLLKTLDPKRFQIQPVDDIPAANSKSPERMISYQNPYYVPKQQSQLRNEQNSYHKDHQFHNKNHPNYNEDNFIEKQMQVVRQYNGGSNFERDPVGYGNSNLRKDSGLASPHASSEKLEENNPKMTVSQQRNDLLDSPNKFSKKQGDLSPSLKKQPSQLSVKIQPHQQAFPQNNIVQSKYKPQTPINIQHPESCCKCKDSAQFQDLITQIVLKNQESQNMIKQLQEFCRFAGQEVEVPSFCKMLALSQ